MKNCDNCTQKVYKGYSRNPRTGRESKKFYCDECYEKLSLRLTQTRAQLDHKVSKRIEITTGKYTEDGD